VSDLLNYHICKIFFSSYPSSCNYLRGIPRYCLWCLCILIM